MLNRMVIVTDSRIKYKNINTITMGGAIRTTLCCEGGVRVSEESTLK